MRKIFAIYFLLNLVFFSAQAQKKIDFEFIGLENGLSQSSVRCILQDSKGFMWFGTLDGLNRYDGYNINVFRNNPNDSTSIVDNSISCLFEDSRQRLWIGVENGGLSRYDKIHQIFVNYSFQPGEKNSLSSNDVTSIAEDDNGSLWVATAAGLHLFDEQTGKFYRFPNGQSKENNQINKIVKDSSGLLWVGTEGGLFRFDPQVRNFYSCYAKNGNVLKQKEIQTLFVDKKGKLWIGTRQGLWFYNPQKEYYLAFRSSDKKNSLSHDVVTSIAQDSAGILWIGTENGLNRFDFERRRFDSFYSDLTQPNSLSASHVLSIYSDQSNILWVGTSLGSISKWNRAAKQFTVIQNNPSNPNSISSNKIRSFYEAEKNTIWVGTVDAGLNKWLVEEDKFVHYPHEPGNPHTISHKHARSICKDNYGNLWVATDGGGLNRLDLTTERFYHYKSNPDDDNSISHDRIWKVYIDSKNYLWVGTFGGGLDRIQLDEAKQKNFRNLEFEHFRYDSTDEKSLSGNFITSILEDHTGKLWIGTYNHGLNLFHPENQDFTYFRQNPEKTNQEEVDRVYSIVEDDRNRLWIGSRGSLNRLDRENMNFQYYDHEIYGFPNHVMMGIVDDSQGNIWITTNRGLAKFFPEKDSVRTYTVSDGLQSNEFMIGAFLKTSSGRILFGGQTGFNAFYPEKIKDNPHIPEVVINGFQVFHKYQKLDSAVSEKKRIFLNYKQNNFTFEFVAIDYVFSQQNQYAYFMEGFDEEMNYVGDRRYASYTNLSPGVYTFKVIGSNNDGKWNREGASIQIVIEPPFWMTTWFKIMMVVLISALVYAGIRLRDVFRDRSELERTVEIRTEEIMKQKEAIMEQNEELHQQQEEILAQRDEIERQRDIANEQRQALTDSITYAQRIQSAILPPSEQIKDMIPEHFILYKPRDIVSGDYYWLTQKQGKIIVVAADCTGHGVPGAFLSMLGVSFLNEIVNTLDEVLASEIVNHLRNYVMKSLHQTEKDSESKDGMDLALCVIDKKTNQMQFCGAYNPLYLIRKIKPGSEAENKVSIQSQNPKEFKKRDPLRREEANGYQLVEIKADRMPVGISDKDKYPFTNHLTQLEKGDTLYLFSDGYVDQFGGPEDKKFKSKPFKRLLLSFQEKSMTEQEKILDQTLEDWKGINEQIDDILVMGIRI